MALITPRVEDRLITWRIPLGQGAIVHVSLDDCEYYVYWLFDYPERSDGIDLEVAIDRIPYESRLGMSRRLWTTISNTSSSLMISNPPDTTPNLPIQRPCR
ncbi:hypothetical protein FOXB_01742 [Fusarium oxysporum f. sp. conglutinans Fo5176]|uniref:Uncharacterized protein n=1 Tax=Fusarium oxysporum (strain Fo5176) TaxID=660025 RepID=F9F5R7_FUSOF|nr:hypothetical protein FOXB_01742 [Fusarium oxysporum f. sp. conglutinans Fo5176]